MNRRKSFEADQRQEKRAAGKNSGQGKDAERNGKEEQETDEMIKKKDAIERCNNFNSSDGKNLRLYLIKT